jgi:Tfp pilus assembly major pilin PilA
MKRAFLIGIFLAIFLLNFISAEIVINGAPKSLYNLGDIVSIPVKITSMTDADDLFSMDLICSGTQTEIYREYIFLKSGEEQSRNPPIPLIKSFIGNSMGNCVIKYSFGNEIKLSDSFEISDSISVNVNGQGKDFNPGQQMEIEGTATRENGIAVNGYVEAELDTAGNESKSTASDTVKSGAFNIAFTIPEGIASGQYLMKINAYEKDSKGEITNTGFYNYNIFVAQVPTNLEIFAENSGINPGETERVKAVLHDQTGQPISSSATIEIRDSNGKLIEQKDAATGEFIEIGIPGNQKPGEWAVRAVSGNLESDSAFSVNEVESISTGIVDKTLIITNTGNVPYEKTVLVKIGSEPMSIDVSLDVGESKKYSLSAPDGEYQVDVIVDGESSSSDSVFLTGKAVDVSESGFTLNSTAIWILIIAVLAFIGYRLFRKWHRKSFFGYMGPGILPPKKEVVQLKKSSVITRNKAELELSIKGDQQDATVICIRIKNIDKLRESRTDYEKVLQEIVNIAEEQKGYVYGAQENIFFIYAPMKTRTFRNERTAMDTAQKMENIISSYNRLAKEKIICGISVNHGAIVAGMDKEVMKFMALGTLMNTSKKLASMSEGEVLLSEKVREKLGADVKTQKKETGGVTAYSIKEVRDEERSKEFIRRFMDRMEK